MSAETNDDDTQRRYDAMVQKIRANNCATTNMMSSHGPALATDSTYAPAGNSVFKLPNTMKTQLEWAKINSQVEIFTQAFRTNPDIDKLFKKIWVQSSMEILYLSQRHKLDTLDGMTILDMLYTAMKTKFYGSRGPQSISSQAQSDLSHFDPFGTSVNMTLNNTNRAFTLDGHSVTAENYNPYVPLHRLHQENQSQIPAQNNNMSAMMQERPSSRLQSSAQSYNTAMMQDRPSSRPQSSAQYNNASTIMQDRPSTRYPSSAQNDVISSLLDDMSSSISQSSAQNNNMSAMMQERPSSRLQSSAQNNNASVMMQERHPRLQPSAQSYNTETMQDRPSSRSQSSAQYNNASTMIQDRPSTRYPSSAQNDVISSLLLDDISSSRFQSSAQSYNTEMMQDRPSSRPQSSGTRILQRNKTQPPSLNSSDKTQKVAAEVHRPGRKAKSPNATLNGSRALQHSVLDTTQSMVGSKGVTRSGRQVKSPNQFWKGIERRLQESSIMHCHSRKQKSSEPSPAQDLNETMTLRNKVVIRNTPARKNNHGAKNTLMATIEEKELDVGIIKKPGPKKVIRRKSINKGNKENESKAAPSRSNQEHKNVKPKHPIIKKAPTKRKPKISELTIAKRKKIEELLSDSCSMNSDSDDELFEPIFQKRRPHTVNQVLSPSNGLQSVKKAAAAATGKETPPAKFISQLVGSESSATTPANLLPESKVSQVVKRVTKVVEKKAPAKASKKACPVNDNNKEDPIVEKILDDIVKSTYTTTSPFGNAVLTVFRGTEPASDEEDLSEDDDDDLL